MTTKNHQNSILADKEIKNHILELDDKIIEIVCLGTCTNGSKNCGTEFAKWTALRLQEGQGVLAVRVVSNSSIMAATAQE